MARRLALTALLAAVLVFQPAFSALADEQWCETDPIFSIAGQPLRANARFVADPADVLYVAYNLRVPEDVDASVIAPAFLELVTSDSTRTPLVAEQAVVARDAAAANGAAFTAILTVTVVTSNSADSYPVTITLFGPYILAPTSYSAIANTTTTIAIPIPGA